MPERAVAANHEHDHQELTNEEKVALEKRRASWSPAVRAYEPWFAQQICVQLKTPAIMIISTDDGLPTPCEMPTADGKGASPAISLYIMGVMEPAPSGDMLVLMYIDPRKRGRDEPRIQRKGTLCMSLLPEQIERVTTVYHKPVLPPAEPSLS